MSDQGQIRQIAMRIRDLREISGDTICECALAVGVPEDTLVKYESGETDIPVGFLILFAAQYKVELATLLTGDNPRLNKFCLTRAGKGIDVERRKQYHYQNLVHNFAHKKLEPFLVVVDPNSNPNMEANSHEGHELNYVIDGKLRISVDGVEMLLEVGDSIYYDAVYPHAMQAVGDSPAKFLAVIVS